MNASQGPILLCGLCGKHAVSSLHEVCKFCLQKAGATTLQFAAPQPQSSPAMRKQVGGDHYKGLAIQPAEYCQRNRLPYCESSVIQYVTRHRDKNGAEDIRKAIHCLEMLLDMEYPES